MLQDEVIRNYDLSSATLEKFFVGPLPMFLSSSSAAKSPAINGCLINSHLSSSQNGVTAVKADIIIDLTEDDEPEVPDVATASVKHAASSQSSANTVHRKKSVKSSKCSVQKNHSSEVTRGTVVSKKRVKSTSSSVRQHSVEVRTVTDVRKKSTKSAKNSAKKRHLAVQNNDPGVTVVPKKRVKTSNSSVDEHFSESAVPDNSDAASHISVESDDIEISTVNVIPNEQAKHHSQNNQRVKSGWCFS